MYVCMYVCMYVYLSILVNDGSLPYLHHSPFLLSCVTNRRVNLVPRQSSVWSWMTSMPNTWEPQQKKSRLVVLTWLSLLTTLNLLQVRNVTDLLSLHAVFLCSPKYILTAHTYLPTGLVKDPIVIPSNGPLTALIATLPLQLLAYELAILKGINPDKPRNLAKAVTVD